MKIIFGLGSNVGDRQSYLKQAIAKLEEYNVLQNIVMSKIYKSKAVLPDGAPIDWDMSFLNMAVMGECDLEPLDVLQKVKLIEAEIGRVDRGFWSPREIDIDILLYGDLNMISEDLTIPHKFLLERDFALLPINDLAPNWIYPRQGGFYKQTISDIIKRNLFDSNSESVDLELVA
jgi:2-amino-4-hydroxy-6-hydroxymethyldihydropteridine diphosphokinase / dihydropteroate synthase